MDPVTKKVACEVRKGVDDALMKSCPTWLHEPVYEALSEPLQRRGDWNFANQIGEEIERRSE
ncbi:hypothetical protein [Nocardiopsis sp. YSL2]|uniref:hypothetical protein n=1 Tax=Nocardiopsis sp. YSL2 TaxID=2939492 RepID=UPI0026F41BE5|nr:hypothetical protein [Nocardiopsis sp. YSL2]